MKFRTFIATFALFLIVFFSSLLFISVFIINNQMDIIKERGINEHYFISSSFGKDLMAIVDRGGNLGDAIEQLFNFYAEYYQKQGVYLELLSQGKIIYSNLPERSNKLTSYAIEPGIRKATFQNIGDSVYFKVVGELPGTDNRFSIQYLHDISGNLKAWQTTQRILLLVGIIFTIILAVSLQLILNRVFEPLDMVSMASRKIANGQYDNRIIVSGRHELAEMAESFNNMAEEIQRRITQLAEAFEQKQQFVDNLAHEIRTPLTSVYGFAEYIQKTTISDEEKMFAASYIMSESQYMLNISNRLLELATLRNQVIKMKVVDVNSLFEHSQKSLAAKLAENQISLKWKIDIDSTYGDKDLLQSLLVNFTDNAIKACNPGGIIVWNAYIENGCRVLSVQDNGWGIPQNEINKVTDPFYRVDKSRNRAKGGVGLGLSICEQIANCHNAVLSIESLPNVGTIVKLTFTSL
ncbi:HAMP domain-containing sensor histidine kinase [Desulfoscipio gibsoniae]|uniref:histidine kinase n=1 Tax=Desulfoscipio gibsoniae DSM 7213 TaxID=767817 RepID=R4KKH3_9FIRM|nr:HAMP domain-containing sensor histidine kinase [Desulfoscipio gibsoniae]AGL00136.1 signal transduction histidine kinase [Desulfoscipio gibsoniae DSM 7213]